MLLTLLCIDWDLRRLTFLGGTTLRADCLQLLEETLSFSCAFEVNKARNWVRLSSMLFPPIPALTTTSFRVPSCLGLAVDSDLVNLLLLWRHCS